MSYQNYKCNKWHQEDECNKCNKCHEENKCCKCCKCHREDECDKCNKVDGGDIHVHEYAESVKLAEEGDDRHNHRVAGVTGEAIPIKNGTDHVHKIKDNTDFVDHFHLICVTTGPMIRIFDENGRDTGKHIHLVSGNTTIFDDHCHPFLFTTQIQAPLLPLQDCNAD